MTDPTHNGLNGSLDRVTGPVQQRLTTSPEPSDRLTNSPDSLPESVDRLSGPSDRINGRSSVGLTGQVAAEGERVSDAPGESEDATTTPIQESEI